MKSDKCYPTFESYNQEAEYLIKELGFTTVTAHNIISFKRAVLKRIEEVKYITQFIQSPNHLVLISPRRFGKTLALNMLKTFFEITDSDTAQFFRDKKIWQCGEK